MQPLATYRVTLEVLLVDGQRHRFVNGAWTPVGRAEAEFGNKVSEWMSE